ncbi:MAG: DUF1549 domain-containing protein [Verrucomicrobia bacterium]|nr:DUF1549 domain-containing protein [Verrucomicrobiota bacterium]
MNKFAVIVLSSAALAASALAKESATSRLRPASERFADLAKAEDPSFRRHVVPLMSRLGCSGRECHGAFSGQGGFRLSLFGYDFEKDHKAITQDSDGGEAEVRVNLKEPLESLIVTKGAMLTKHKGKERFKKDSWEYNLLLKWVQDGAKLDVEQTGDFDRLEVFPKEIVFQKAGDVVQLKVLAHWRDGTIEDVTQITRFRSNDDSVAAISDTGKAESKGKGDTHIVAFYDNGVLPVPAMLAMSEFTGSKYPKVPTKTKVDEMVVGKLRKAGIVPSEICTDSEFIRRVSLDLTATPPTPDAVRAFLADKSPDKRAKKIEELLKTPDYAAWWTTLLCDFTGNNPRQLNTGGDLQLNDRFSRQWYDWIYKRVNENTPYDQLVAGIVLASSRSRPDQSYEDFAKEMGSYFRDDNRADFACRDNMPYFWVRQNVRKAEEKALAFAHTFLGVRIECAQCHKHPFDQWTQTDFKQFQAFFEPVNYGGRGESKEDVNYASLSRAIREKIGYDQKTDKNRNMLRTEMQKMLRAGEMLPWQEVYVSQRPQRKMSDKEIERMKQRDPNFNGRVITPKILGGEEVMLNSFPDPRGPLMDWLRAKDNPYFARALVNRAWAVYFGRGIVEPADDMNLANPPSNKELMDHLATGFAAHGFDMKWLHREIANSDTYQRSWKTTPSNKLDEKNFSHAMIRRLPAEVVFDSITIATASASGQKKFNEDLDNRAIGPNASISGKTRGGDNYTLSTFGKPARLANCDCERTSDPTLLQTLYTRNDPSFLQLVDSQKRDGSGWIDELRRATSPESSPERIKAELAKLEAGKARLTEQRTERANGKLLAEKDRQKFEAQMAEVDERIARAKKTLASSQSGGAAVDFDRSIEEVFLRTVARPPTKEEFAKAKQDVDAAPNKVDGVRELLWVMLNTREFMVNH